MLIEFCKNNISFIANDRVGEDKDIGLFTCKGSSVVDFVICSPIFFKIIQEFSVLEISKLYSDVHSPIHLTLECKDKHVDIIEGEPRLMNKKRKRWGSEKSGDF